MIEAQLNLETRNPQEVSEALDIDNVASEGFNVSCKPKNQSISFNIKTKSISTLIATVDDILKCHKAAQEVL